VKAQEKQANNIAPRSGAPGPEQQADRRQEKTDQESDRQDDDAGRHMDDLAGYILSDESDVANAEQWRISPARGDQPGRATQHREIREGHQRSWPVVAVRFRGWM
jgi:hypothetical protein